MKNRILTIKSIILKSEAFRIKVTEPEHSVPLNHILISCIAFFIFFILKRKKMEGISFFLNHMNFWASDKTKPKFY